MVWSAKGLCTTCDELNVPGSCARGRCYCGHETCHGYDSYVDLSTLPLHDPPTSNKTPRGTWDNRKSQTWIDQM